MSDLISRADAIEAVCDKCPISFKEKCEWKDNGHCSTKVALDALPSADAVEVDRTSEWVAVRREEYEDLIADAEPKMTEEVREALMRLTMCAREECDMCKYKDKCGFEFQYNISTENMHTILDALSDDAVQGEWIDRSEGGRVKYPWWESCECNQCGEYGSGAYNFCPNCGARMKGGAE